MSAQLDSQASELVSTTTTTTANASLSYLVQASTLRKSSYVLLPNSRPCKISSLSTSKPGKHGHAKVAITAIDVFTGRKYEHVCPAHGTVEVPEVRKREYVVLDVDGEWLSLLDEVKGEVREDVRVPGEGEMEMKERIEKGLRDGGKGVIVVVLGCMGEEKVVEVKEGRE